MKKEEGWCGCGKFRFHDIMRGMTENINFAKIERESKSHCVTYFPFLLLLFSLSASSKIYLFFLLRR